MEGRHELVFRFALDVQAEDVARLDGLEILAALLAPEAERLHKRGKRRVARRHVRVELDDVGLIFFCQLLRTLEQLGERLAVVQIADRPAAAVHQRPADAGHPARHQGQRALDLSALAAHGDGVPRPHGLLFGPETALRKMALRMALQKRLVFRKRLVGNQFIHGGTSPEEYLCVFVIRHDVGADDSAGPPDSPEWAGRAARPYRCRCAIT